MSRVVRRGGIDYVVCDGCGCELDGTGTCPNDCLADDDADFNDWHSSEYGLGTRFHGVETFGVGWPD